MAQKSSSADDAIIIKKYANRRLYNTATSSYVTLENLCEMVKEGKEFVVRDAKTGKDITHSVLTQIIFEEEGKGQSLLPIQFLRQLIQFYGDNLQSLVPSYLQMSMDMLSREQDQLKDVLSSSFGGQERLNQFEEQIRQNFAIFENAVHTFSPFGPWSSAAKKPKPSHDGASSAPKTKTGTAPDNEPDDESEASDQIDALKRQLTAMQTQLDRLASKKKKS